MRVLVYGVNTHNKGAHLLFTTVASRLRALGHTPLVSAREVDSRSRIANGAGGVFSVERLGGLRSLGIDRIPSAVGRRFPVVGDSCFDYVLDASGFSLTDAWGVAPVASRISRYERWSRRGIGVSFLPQAFGPFEKVAVREGVARIIEYADVLWARDEVSREHLLSVGGTKDSVFVAPDITIAEQAPPVDPATRGHVLIIPNWNLTRKTAGIDADGYVRSLVEISRGLMRRGQQVMGLCHEGDDDLQLIRRAASEVPGMKILAPSTAQACKAAIAGADMVVSGRYHGLVSALATGVPVVAHSWSHKYSALMSDFDVVNGIANPADPDETLARIDALDREAERKRLGEVLPEVAARVERVWERVASMLETARR